MGMCDISVQQNIIETISMQLSNIASHIVG